MKQINNYILEKFVINSKTKLSEWNIKNAEDGDFVKWRNIYFIYKDINTGYKYSDNLDDDIIIYYATYNKKTKRINIGPSAGVGSLGTISVTAYELLNDNEKEEFIKALKDKGYKWDDNKKELIEI